MSSENEIVNQPGNDQPEIEIESQQTDPVSGSVTPEPSEMGETAVSPSEEMEDGWAEWIAANPEEEEELVPPVGAVVEEEIVVEEFVAVVETVDANSEEDVPPAETEAPEAVPEPVESNVKDEEPTEETSPKREEVPAKPSTPVQKPASPPRKRKDNLTAQDVITYFAPCGRCGFFLSGYRAAYGRENLETAVFEAKSGWITLTWGQETRELVLKSFGSRIEENDLHFDGCCSECRRAFVYKSSRSEGKPPLFRIEIKPRKRQ